MGDEISLSNIVAGSILAIGHGGTAASTASNARTNLGVQENDADLTAIAGLSSSDGKFIVGSTSGWVAESGATARTSLGLGTAAVLATGISDTNVPKFTSGVADDDFLRVSGTEIEGRSAAQVLSDIGFLGGTVTSGVSSFSTTALSGAESADGVLTYDNSAGTIKWHTLASICFLKGTKITLPDRSQINIEDLTLDDEVLTYNIDVISEIKNKNILKNVEYSNMDGRFSKSGIRNIWINPTDSYLTINDKLNITKNHIIHFKRDNNHYFRYAEHLSIGDELFNDRGEYESVESIEEVNEKKNVYNFELDKDNTYFAENYLVHHYCKLCSGYSNII